MSTSYTDSKPNRLLGQHIKQNQASTWPCLKVHRLQSVLRFMLSMYKPFSAVPDTLFQAYNKLLFRALEYLYLRSNAGSKWQHLCCIGASGFCAFQLIGSYWSPFFAHQPPTYPFHKLKVNKTPKVFSKIHVLTF